MNSQNKIYYRAKEVAELLGIGLSTVWYWVKKGLLPQPAKLSARVTVWDINEIRRFVDGRHI
jgi:predicted DNA-binding transcriptional regulator AlpA